MTEAQRAILAGLEQEVNDCRNGLSAALARLKDTQVSFSGVRIGDIVQSKRYGLCRVSHIDARWADAKPWVQGNAKKKDGTWGTAERHLYDAWELV